MFHRDIDEKIKQRRMIITTSWDDGCKQDLKLSELLVRYGVKGTFYVSINPINSDIVPLDRSEIYILQDMGMEIGAHGVTHRVLPKLRYEEVLYEVAESKKYLEQLLGKQVESFCYPKGKYSSMVLRAVQQTGYLLGRTTVSFNTETSFAPFKMPVTFQFFPHKAEIHVRHALKEGNIRGLTFWLFKLHMETDLIRLTDKLLENILLHGGVLHVWGHSWEIERFGLWDKLEEVLRIISGYNEVHYLTNAEVIKNIQQVRTI
jgi:peptidoglycan/xylan/chitin deacetylase (PgdA/CDA1 family)